MRNNSVIFEVQHKPRTQSKVILDCINSNDIFTYCINNKQNNSGIIAGIGTDNEINCLIDVDLDKPKNRAHIDIKSLKTMLSVPAINQGIFLNQIAGKTLYSLDVTYNFGEKLSHDLDVKHQEYCKTVLNKHKFNPLIILNKHKGNNR